MKKISHEVWGERADWVGVEAKPASLVSEKRVQKIVASNLKRKKPSGWINELADEVMALRRAIEFQGNAMRRLTEKVDLERAAWAREKREFENRISEMIAANQEGRYRKNIRSRLSDLLEEI